MRAMDVFTGLPDWLRLECQPIDHLQGDLFPEESQQLARAVPKRRREFTAGRTLARRLLVQAGYPAGAIPADASRCPRWPEGVAGSISHSESQCAAALASLHDCRSIGVDLESIGAVTPDLWPYVFTPAEQQVLQTTTLASPETAKVQATLGFSAKEAFFKCQYPLTKLWLDFPQAEIRQLSARSFTLELTETLPELPRTVSGLFWPVPGQQLLTLLWL